MAEPKTISEVAKEVGLSTSSLRRWEAEKRLSFIPDRSPNGYRVYSDDQVKEILCKRDEIHQRGVAMTKTLSGQGEVANSSKDLLV